MPLSQPEIEPQEQPEISEPTTPRQGLDLPEAAAVAEAQSSPEQTVNHSVVISPAIEAARSEAKTAVAFSIEARSIANSIDAIKGVNEQDPAAWERTLSSTLLEMASKNPELGITNQAQAQAVASELIKAEQNLIGRLKEQIDLEYQSVEAKPAAELVNQAVNSIREAYFSAILSTNISFASISNLVSKIKFTREPSDEIKARHNSQQIGAYYETKDGRGVMHIYERFIIGGQAGSPSPEGQSHLALHELGHGLENSEIIDAAQYNDFLSHAGSLDSDFSALPPHLQEIVKIVRNPEENFGIWNSYIDRNLRSLSAMPESPDKGGKRIAVARELVADMFADYLNISPAGDPENVNLRYLMNRWQFCSTEEILGHIRRQSHCDDEAQMQQFLSDNGVTIRSDMSAGEIFNELSKIKEYSYLLGVNQAWYEFLKDKLNSGNQIGFSPQSVASEFGHNIEPDDAELGGWYAGDSMGGGGYQGGSGTSGGPGGMRAAEEAVDKAVKFITGVK